MAFRTDVTAFANTLSAQGAQLDRLLVLNKAQVSTQPRAVSAGDANVNFFVPKSTKASSAPSDELLARFALELMRARYVGRTTPGMGKLVQELRRCARRQGGRQGAMLAGLANLGEAIHALPRMWGNKAPPVAKGYPEYDPSQPRDTGGRFAGGSGGAGSAGGGESRRGMSERRAELFDSYKRKYGYFPPRGMPNQRISMWVEERAPAGQDVTHEVRGTLQHYRSDDTWAETFQRVSKDVLSSVANYVAHPVIVDTLVTLALYGLATRYVPAVATANTGLKHALNRAVSIVGRRIPASSKDLLDTIDNIAGMFPRGSAARVRRGFFG